MKKAARRTSPRILFISLALVLVAILGFTTFWLMRSSEGTKTSSASSIVLNSEYTNTDGKAIDISKQTEDVEGFLDGLINEKKSFVVYVSLPVCSGETAEFKEYVTEFQKNEKLSFYYITSDYVKDTSIYETVKYFPSVIIYDQGKIVTYLRFDSDEDAKYYKSYDEFKKWFYSTVIVEK